ncbi:HlyD family secretion protein [Paracoccus luteus]|uniref:HlyD family secretion protein n=1 Tax=Paracoccus luteus TaxID=2508543 RepID=UPI00106FC0A9|nr:HlyD family secretion protein [Paracoccus luteus]
MTAPTRTIAPTPTPTDAPAPPVTPTPDPARPRRKGRRILLMLAVPVLLLAGGGWVWLSGGRYEATENAYLHVATVAIASDISGRVVQSNVADNQVVREGDVLFSLDPEPARLAVSEADAALAGARLGVEQMKAAWRQSLAQEEVARSDVAFRQTELDRQAALAERGVATTATLDEAKHALRAAQEQLTTLQRATASALAALGGDADAPTDSHPSVQAALAARDKAAYTLGLATVRAPADGVIYKAASFRPGQFVGAGAPLFSLVETGDLWIDANFKETQLAHIAPGQRAEVEFDMAPGQSFAATVEAVGAGTGAEFSLLPAQNATGNWVKVTQRVPVRLRLEAAEAAPLVSGVSASVTVDTGVTRSLPHMPFGG